MAAVRRNHSKFNDSCREKIQTTQLTKRLQDHALGIIELTPTQLKAIEILLRKTLPDLSTVTHEGGDKPIQHEYAVSFE